MILVGFGLGGWVAAELAVMVEIKRRNIKLSRDLILLSEADEEAGSTGIEWVIQHGWPLREIRLEAATLLRDAEEGDGEEADEGERPQRHGGDHGEPHDTARRAWRTGGIGRRRERGQLAPT